MAPVDQVAGQHGSGAADPRIATDHHRPVGFGLLVDELNHPLDLVRFGRCEVGYRLKHVHQVDHLSGCGRDCSLLHPYHGAHALVIEEG